MRPEILVHIIKFLTEVIKTASDLTLQSYAFYAMTCIALRLIDLPVDGKGAGEAGRAGKAGRGRVRARGARRDRARCLII